MTQYIMSQREARKKEGNEVASEKVDGQPQKAIFVALGRKVVLQTTMRMIPVEAEVLETLDTEKPMKVLGHSIHTFNSLPYPGGPAPSPLLPHTLLPKLSEDVCHTVFWNCSAHRLCHRMITLGLWKN